MRTFLINLDKNADRLAYMDRQLKQLGISYERYCAVYGKALGKAELQKSFAPIRSFCVEGRRLVAGEIGCALSHIGVYRRMVEENIPVALILEDDVQFLPELPQAIRRVEEFVDGKKPQVVMLSFHGHGFGENINHGIEMEPIGGATATDAYCITKKAAERIIQSNYPVVSVADRWGRWRKHLKIEMYRIWPVVAAQDRVVWHAGLPDIDLKQEVLHGIKKMLHKMNRCWQVAIDNMMFLVLGH